MTAWFHEFIRHFKSLLQSEITQNGLREVRTPYCTQINNTCVGFMCTLMKWALHFTFCRTDFKALFCSWWQPMKVLFLWKQHYEDSGVIVYVIGTLGIYKELMMPRMLYNRQYPWKFLINLSNPPFPKQELQLVWSQLEWRISRLHKDVVLILKMTQIYAPAHSLSRENCSGKCVPVVLGVDTVRSIESARSSKFDLCLYSCSKPSTKKRD